MSESNYNFPPACRLLDMIVTGYQRGPKSRTHNVRLREDSITCHLLDVTSAS